MKKTYEAMVGCLNNQLIGDYFNLKEFKSKREAIAWLNKYAINENKRDYRNCNVLDYCVLIKDDIDADCIYSIVFKKINCCTWEKIGG